MLRTITIGTTVSVQGVFVRDMPDGRISVKVDNNVYTGKPITRKNQLIVGDSPKHSISELNVQDWSCTFFLCLLINEKSPAIKPGFCKYH